MSANAIEMPTKPVSVPPDVPLPRPLSRGNNYFLDLLALIESLARKIQVRQKKKRLRICESVPLGDKRFVAVIQVDNQQFLLGGSANSISLLAQLEKPAEFTSVLNARVHEVNG